MNLSHLKNFDLIYLATPFTRYAAGIEAAFVDACKLSARLVHAGLLNIHSPIVEAYPIALHGGLDPLDLAIWQPFCAATLDKSDALIVAMLDGWEASSGVRHEIEEFDKGIRPVVFLSPIDLSCVTSTRSERLILGRAA